MLARVFTLYVAGIAPSLCKLFGLGKILNIKDSMFPATRDHMSTVLASCHKIFRFMQCNQHDH
jgi:hypothetical protein